MNDFAHNQVRFAYQGLDDAWPDIDPGVEPLGNFVLFQIRAPKAQTAGGIILPDEVRNTESWNTQIAKVRAVGPLCFRNPDTLELWPEGAWIKPGDYVRVPKHGGDKWTVTHGDVEIMFVVYAVKDIIGKVTGDPLAMKAFI